MSAGRRFRLVAAAFLLTALVPLAVGQDLDPAKQRDAQKKVQAQIDEAAHRTAATLSAMKYLRMSRPQEQEMLKEVADNLRGLSDDQIKAILTHLDAAVKAPDQATATKQQREAYEKHRQVVERLRELTLKMNAIRSLEEAAARLDQAAANQLDQANTSTVAAQPSRAASGRRGGAVVSDTETAADEQSKLKAETASVAKQLAGLVPHLTPEHKERLEKAEASAKGQRLASEMDETARDLLRGGSFDDAGER